MFSVVSVIHSVHRAGWGGSPQKALALPPRHIQTWLDLAVQGFSPAPHIRHDKTWTLLYRAPPTTPWTYSNLFNLDLTNRGLAPHTSPPIIVHYEAWIFRKQAIGFRLKCLFVVTNFYRRMNGSLGPILLDLLVGARGFLA